MSLLIVRGGIPAPHRGTALGLTPVYIPIGGNLVRLPEYNVDGRASPGVSMFLQVQNHDVSDALRVYFHEAHATAGEHYILVHNDTAGGAFGEWEGPAETKGIWVAADTNTISAYDVTAFLRRG